MSDPLKGLDIDKASAWLAANVPAIKAPFSFALVAAGGSNLTYKVTDANGRAVVLRRPPMRGQLATAHDMAREWRIMHALGSHDSGVPVPGCLAECTDTDVLGAGFYVMDFVDGLILRDSKQASTLSAEQARVATESLVDVQVAMHTVDLEATGLSDLGKHSGYVERQLGRWKKQVDASQTRELALLNDLHKRLSAGIPTEQGKPGLAHGDYRFDNVVLGADSKITAVLDWELCTIGEPVADFVWSLCYWADPTDTMSFLPDPPTKSEQFMRRAEVAKLYAARSGFDLSDLDYYTAFSWWKMACIVEGVYGRMLKGATGGMKTGPLEQVAALVESYLAHADALLRK